LFHENLTNPWSIAVDPRAGVRFLFLTDWGKNPRIERCSMDGQQRLTIVNDSIQMPLGLTLDLIREEVYFTDRHLNYIEVVNYNGEYRRKIIGNTHFLHAPTSITIFEHYLYWYDSNSNEIRRLNRFEHGIKAQQHERIMFRSNVNHMKISHQAYQPLGNIYQSCQRLYADMCCRHTTNNASRSFFFFFVFSLSESNPCQQSRCTQLCLLSHVTTSGYACACSTGYFLEQDQFTCSKGMSTKSTNYISMNILYRQIKRDFSHIFKIIHRL
jgi:hypothetical protein